ncbi:MAG: DUF2231 domain-containing protein [Acidobacteriota bacterium]
MAIELLHPAFVHFPVSLCAVGAGFLLYGRVRGREEVWRCGLASLLVGSALSVPAYLTGQVARAVMEDSERFLRAEAAADLHEDLGLLSLGAFVALGILSGLELAKKRTARSGPWVLPLLAMAAALLVAATAYQGGRLVFEYGVGVRAAAPAPLTPPASR